MVYDCCCKLTNCDPFHEEKGDSVNSLLRILTCYQYTIDTSGVQ